jgi:hypothetical protein
MIIRQLSTRLSSVTATAVADEILVEPNYLCTQLSVNTKFLFFRWPLNKIISLFTGRRLIISAWSLHLQKCDAYNWYE